MKRYGTAILDPIFVRAVVPGARHYPNFGQEKFYRVLFADGATIELDAEAGVALMADLVGPSTSTAGTHR